MADHRVLRHERGTHRHQRTPAAGGGKLGSGDHAERGRGTCIARARQAGRRRCPARDTRTWVSPRRAAMSEGTSQATSIRRRLLIFLLPPLTLLMLAGAYSNYRAATVFMRAAFDQRLADAARTLAAHMQ